MGIEYFHMHVTTCNYTINSLYRFSVVLLKFPYFRRRHQLPFA